MSDEWGKMRRREYQLAKGIVEKFLEGQEAGPEVLAAFKMVTRSSTTVEKFVQAQVAERV